MNTTTVWQTIRNQHIEHARRIADDVTLCGIGTEHTRNHLREADRFVDVKQCTPCTVQRRRIIEAEQ